jgi:uncharacterized lipoprotein YmbA
MKRYRVVATALIASAIAVGCAKGPPPKFYMLDTPAATEPEGLEQGLIIGIGPVTLPAHLDRNQIVSRESGVKLMLSEGEQWAEPLKEGVIRVLTVQLAVTLNSNRIFSLPLRQRRPLDFQVAIDVLRFDGIPGGDVVLGARWTVLSGDGKDLLLSQVSLIRESTGGPEVAQIVEAQSRAIAKLGAEIGAKLKERQS